MSPPRIALMKGRTFKVTLMGSPPRPGNAVSVRRPRESAITGQLKAIGITVVVRHLSDDYPGGAYLTRAARWICSIGARARTTADPITLLDGLSDDSWLGRAEPR